MLEVKNDIIKLEPGKVIYPLSDVAFKNILKDIEHRDYLAMLISIAIKYQYDYVFDNIVLVDTDTLEDKVKEHHNTGDLVVHINDKKIDVEAYSGNKDVNVRKNIVTSGKYYSNSFKTKDKHKIPRYFYQIFISDFDVFHNKHLINEANFIEKTSGNFEPLTDEIKIFNINLNLLKEKCYNLTQEERYLKLLITDDKDELYKIAGDDEIMKKVVKKLEVLSEDTEVLSEYTKEQILKYSLDIALIDKEKEGIEKGKIEEKIEIAKKMLSKNIDIDFIIECTGLTKEEIEKLT